MVPHIGIEPIQPKGNSFTDCFVSLTIYYDLVTKERFELSTSLYERDVLPLHHIALVAGVGVEPTSPDYETGELAVSLSRVGRLCKNRTHVVRFGI